MNWRRNFVGILGGGALVICASCQGAPADNCDAIVTRCDGTVCDYWCDDFGCYPDCYENCWDECVRYPRQAPVQVAPDAGVGDADAGAPDAAAGVLCSPCTGSDQCEKGALCLSRSGDASPSQPRFCGRACQTNAECPLSFACTQLGATRQCLPLGGSCQ